MLRQIDRKETIKSRSNVKIHFRIKHSTWTRNEKKFRQKCKRQLERCTSSLCTQASFETTARHKSTSQLSSILLLPRHLSLNNQPPSVSDRVNGAKSCSFFEEARADASKRSSQHGNTFYPLSFLLSVPFPFRRSSQRLTSFHGLYLSSRIISFVSLLRQPFSQTAAALSAVYHTRKGGGTIVPSFASPPPRDRKPSSRSIESRTRSSYFCIQFHEISRSRFICSSWRRGFVRCLLIAFHIVNFLFFEEENIVSSMNHEWCKIGGFCFVSLILTIRVIVLTDMKR